MRVGFAGLIAVPLLLLNGGVHQPVFRRPPPYYSCRLTWQVLVCISEHLHRSGEKRGVICQLSKDVSIWLISRTVCKRMQLRGST